jgi:uncharacterized protein (DUF488 family)
MTRESTVWTIGHSNRSLGEFLALLRGSPIEAVADVRRYPASRVHPHFDREELERSLAEEGIAYRHFVDLGGRRSKRAAGSVNTAWRVDAFNAFADHMQTETFSASLAGLIELAEARRTAIMCAEALPWQCHRRLIADALVAKGFCVMDIIGPGQVRPHELPDFARVAHGQVTYPRRHAV